MTIRSIRKKSIPSVRFTIIHSGIVCPNYSRDHLIFPHYCYELGPLSLSHNVLSVTYLDPNFIQGYRFMSI